MESPAKRLRSSPPSASLAATEVDYISFGNPDGGDDAEALARERYGFNTTLPPNASLPPKPPPQQWRGYLRSEAFQRRHAHDRPQSRHVLPGHEPWELVRTRGGRQFVHNPRTKESYWSVPAALTDAVVDFGKEDDLKTEREDNARWAEEQLVEMRKSMAGTPDARITKGAGASDGSRGRRRRSESLQKEDEEALMVMIAAEAEKGEEQDARELLEDVRGSKPVAAQQEEREAEKAGYDSDSSYEEVEVTDSEGERDRGDGQTEADSAVAGTHLPRDGDGPVEFGEDDIAYQLDAMDETYDVAHEADYSDEDGGYEQDPDGMSSVSSEAATNLFRAMLDDHGISPFTPWDKLVADSSEAGIVNDDRYALLPTTRLRKETWEAWVKDTTARVREERAKQGKHDPRVAYMELLAKHASPKLYWAEFKRKFRKDAAMTNRQLSDKERERLYREHTAKR